MVTRESIINNRNDNKLSRLRLSTVIQNTDGSWSVGYSDDGVFVDMSGARFGDYLTAYEWLLTEEENEYKKKQPTVVCHTGKCLRSNRLNPSTKVSSCVGPHDVYIYDEGEVTHLDTYDDAHSARMAYVQAMNDIWEEKYKNNPENLTKLHQRVEAKTKPREKKDVYYGTQA